MSGVLKGENHPQVIVNIFNGVMWTISFILETLKFIVLMIYYYIEAFISLFCADRKNVAGKIVLITGSANGIGRQIAINFAHLGAILVLWDIDEEGNEETFELAKKEGALAVYAYKCDLRNREEIYAVADQVRMDVGDVDILINDAAILKGKNFIDLPDAEAEETIAANLSAQFWTCKAFLPHMIACNSGHLVTISSIVALIGANKMSVYGASKAGDMSFLEAVALEMRAAGKKGIKTTIVFPLLVDTGLVAPLRTENTLLPALTKEYAGQKIVDAILKDQFYLFLPGLLRILCLKGFFPKKALFLIGEYLGIFNLMEQFTSQIGTEKKNK